MDSPYIVKFVGVSWVRPIDMECIIEYMNFGDLRPYLANHTRKQFTWTEKAKCIESIVYGLLHSNELLDSGKGTKITDFGVSSEDTDDTTKTNGVAPEVINDSHYTTADDNYSFGTILRVFTHGLHLNDSHTHKEPYSDMTHPCSGRLLNQQYVINGVAKGKHLIVVVDALDYPLPQNGWYSCSQDTFENPLRKHSKTSSVEAKQQQNILGGSISILQQLTSPLHVMGDMSSTLDEFSKIQFECAQFTLPLCHAGICDSNNTIQIFVKRVLADKQDPKAVWLLQGGPGASTAGAMEKIMANVYRALGGTATVYTMDHRGTGRSHRLGCTAAQVETSGSPSNGEITPEVLSACIQDVNVQLGASPNSSMLSAYSTTSAALDVSTLINNTNNTNTYVYEEAAATTLSSCPYLGGSLVANNLCKSSTLCLVNTKCQEIQSFPDTQTAFTLGSNGVGDLEKYPSSSLNISNAMMDFKLVQLPDTLKTLILNTDVFASIGDFTLPQYLESLTIQSCPWGTDFPTNFTWPSTLLELTVVDGDLHNAPTSLPTSLRSLTLTSTLMTEVNERDWSSLESLRLSGISTISNVIFSSQLQLFNCQNCNITSFTVDTSSYEALNSLAPLDSQGATGYNVAGITTDSQQCTGRNGAVQDLWGGHVCVIGASIATASGNDVTMWLTGASVAIVALLAIILLLCWQRRRQRRKEGYTTISDETALSSSSTALYTDLDDLRLYKMDTTDLTTTKLIASGAFGEVWLGTYAQNVPVAIKRNKSKDAVSIEHFIAEIKLMSKMDSPYIVKFIGASWIRPLDIECVVEYMDLGDLRSYLATYSPSEFQWADKAQCIQSIVRGLLYLHTFDPPIIHRDLKSRNVLMDSKTGTKLTDFGVSRAASEGTMTSGVGTYQWMAPEIINGSHYTVAADVYSFGVLLSEFSTHKVPYTGLTYPDTGRAYTTEYLISKVATGDLTPEFDPESPSWLQEVGTRCVAINPEDRPTTLELTVLVRQFLRMIN
ncbi:kinase [Thraustotheca clavata]|uniref:Kinase n=1 Tax=Thraustotheca clavata TaxID=74557 RepID=A0A1W0A3V0_9STRA|nr:kinase [Thraustotheca clavata]